MHLMDKQVFTKTGIYKGNVVAVKELKRKTVSLERSLLIELEEAGLIAWQKNATKSVYSNFYLRLLFLRSLEKLIL